MRPQVHEAAGSKHRFLEGAAEERDLVAPSLEGPPLEACAQRPDLFSEAFLA